MPLVNSEDLDKTLWRIIKEQSLTLGNIQPHIVVTESPLFNQETLLSGSLETFGNETYDIKAVLISENDNLTSITKMLLKFPHIKDSVVNIVELPEDQSGWHSSYFYSILRQFNKEWKDDVSVDVSITDKKGKFKHILKATSSCPEKIELLKKEVEKMNKLVEDTIGVKVKSVTKIIDKQTEDSTCLLNELPKTEKLFFTGKKKNMNTMLQSLLTYVKQEFQTIDESMFIFDYVELSHLET